MNFFVSIGGEEWNPDPTADGNQDNHASRIVVDVVVVDVVVVDVVVVSHGSPPCSQIGKQILPVVDRHLNDVCAGGIDCRHSLLAASTPYLLAELIFWRNRQVSSRHHAVWAEEVRGGRELPTIEMRSFRIESNHPMRLLLSIRPRLMVILLVLMTASSAMADDWYRWRGPDLNGISRESDWLHRWPDGGAPVLWKQSVGTGFSSVVTSRGRVYTMGNEDNVDTVYCFHADSGHKLWSYSYPSPLGDNFFAGGPTSTPTIDGDWVYTLSRHGKLYCFQAATGAIRWTKSIVEENEIRVPGWGFSSSPLIHHDLLLLNVGEAGTAVDKSTGRTIWSSADKDAGYATIVPVWRNEQWQAIVSSAKFIIGVELETGEELWRHRWLTRNGCNAADPIVAEKRLFISSGYNRGSALLSLDDEQPEVLWTSKEMQNQFSSSVLLDGFLYGVDGDTTSQQQLKCMAFETGEIQWSADGMGSAALTAANGHLIILSENGELIVARAAVDGFHPLAQAKVLEGTCWTVPVLSDGRIYCRNAAGDLVCVDVQE